MLQLSTKCSAFNAQGSRLIIVVVVVQVRAVKIYVAAAVKALGKKGKTGWNSVYYQNWWFSEFHTPPPLNANVLFFRFFLNFTCVWPNSGFWCCVCLTLRRTLMYQRFLTSSFVVLCPCSLKEKVWRSFRYP
jgi:hypothetical protein